MGGDDGARRLWMEEYIQDDLRWSMSVENILHQGHSEFQAVELCTTGPFGKVLLLDGKLQSSEADEFVYHELLVHPAMLHHPNPKRVFICGGGEGSTAREVLRHKTVEECVMVDIDKLVCDFCAEHLEDNKGAFADPRLRLIIDDARAQLEAAVPAFDVIIGDLADPVSGGPCYHLYTQEFYKDIVLQKLNPGGIFVTQSGPAGILSHQQVFTSINRTLREVFPTVQGYHSHIPSFCDTWGWNMAFSDAATLLLSPQQLDERAASRLNSPLKFLDGEAFQAVSSLNKVVRQSLANEQHVLSTDNPRFIPGSGIKSLV